MNALNLSAVWSQNACMELVADKQLCYPVLWLAMSNDY